MGDTTEMSDTVSSRAKETEGTLVFVLCRTLWLEVMGSGEVLERGALFPLERRVRLRGAPRPVTVLPQRPFGGLGGLLLRWEGGIVLLGGEERVLAGEG